MTWPLWRERRREEEPSALISLRSYYFSHSAGGRNLPGAVQLFVAPRKGLDSSKRQTLSLSLSRCVHAEGGGNGEANITSNQQTHKRIVTPPSTTVYIQEGSRIPPPPPSSLLSLRLLLIILPSSSRCAPAACCVMVQPGADKTTSIRDYVFPTAAHTQHSELQQQQHTSAFSRTTIYA